MSKAKFFKGIIKVASFFSKRFRLIFFLSKLEDCTTQKALVFVTAVSFDRFDVVLIHKDNCEHDNKILDNQFKSNKNLIPVQNILFDKLYVIYDKLRNVYRRAKCLDVIKEKSQVRIFEYYVLIYII